MTAEVFPSESAVKRADEKMLYPLNKKVTQNTEKPLTAWEMERNRDTAKIQWHFQTGDAREKLISLYPTLSSVTF